MDMSLSKLRDNLKDKSNLLQRFPYDPYIRGNFLSTLKLIERPEIRR